MDALVSGRGGIVVLRGTPGSGRSRLLALAGEHAAGAGLTVLRATGYSAERDLPLGAARQLFESRVVRAQPDERRRLLSGPAALAAPLLDPRPDDPVDVESSSALLHGLYHVCGRLGGSGPVVLLLDDAPAMDEDTLLLLAYLGRRLDELPLLLLLSADADTDLPVTLESVIHHARSTQVLLGPLGREDSAAWLRDTAFPEAPDDFCEACYDATLGDRQLLPLLARDLAKQRTPRASYVEKAAPATIASRVRLRLVQAGPSALDLAETVAVMGGDAEVRHVAAVMGVPPQLVVRVAEQLVRMRILRGVHRLSFLHPVVARSLYAHASPARRADVHLCVARLLYEDGGADALIADHLVCARRTGDRHAVAVLESAAEAALAQGRPELAARYLERALAEPPSPERRDALTVRLGRAEAMTGAPEALERMRAAGAQLSGSAERALSHLWSGRVLVAQGRYRAAADSFRSGLEQEPPEEPLRTQLTVSYAVTARLGFAEPPGDLTAAGAPERVVFAADRLELAYAALDAALRGRPAEESRAMALRALGSGSLVEEEAHGVGVHLAALALALSGDLQSAEAVLTAVIELNRERGASSDAALAHAVRAGVILRRGRLSDVLADLQAARTAHAGAWREASFPVQAVLPLVQMEEGRLDRAEAQIARWSRSADPTGGVPYLSFLMTRGRLRRMQGRPDEALADFLDCGYRAAELGIVNPAAFPWRSQAALTRLQAGQRLQASALVQAELTLARASGTPEAIGQTLHVLGLVEEGEESLKLLEEAASVLEGSMAVLLRARALIELGAALRKASRQRAAREPLKRGLDLARRCHAGALVQRGTEELAMAGARPRRLALTGSDALTTRERQVAGLARQGRSNREIADALVVTVKTVEWHLRQAYRKLEIASRSDLPDDLVEPDPASR